MKNLSLKTRITRIFGVGVGTTVLILTIYSLINSRLSAIESAKNEVVFGAEKYALKIKAEMEIAMDATNTMASALTSFKKNSKIKIDREGVIELLKQVLRDQLSFIGIAAIYEPNAFDGEDKKFVLTAGHDSTGRFLPYLSRDKNDELVLEPVVDYNTGDFYQLPKKTLKEVVTEPYLYPVRGKDVLMTSIASPIKINNVFSGLPMLILPLSSCKI